MALRDDRPLQDITGRYLTKALFVELTSKDIADRYPPMCTLKEAHDLYMEVGDLTEYEFAKMLLDSPTTNFWDHWLKLVEQADFRVHLDKWRAELEVNIRAKAIRAMITNSKTDKGAAAARWLAEKGWLNNPNDRKAGRPSKEEVQREAEKQAGIHQILSEDADRLGIKH